MLFSEKLSIEACFLVMKFFKTLAHSMLLNLFDVLDQNYVLELVHKFLVIVPCAFTLANKFTDFLLDLTGVVGFYRWEIVLDTIVRSPSARSLMVLFDTNPERLLLLRFVVSLWLVVIGREFSLQKSFLHSTQRLDWGVDWLLIIDIDDLTSVVFCSFSFWGLDLSLHSSWVLFFVVYIIIARWRFIHGKKSVRKAAIHCEHFSIRLLRTSVVFLPSLGQLVELFWHWKLSLFMLRGLVDWSTSRRCYRWNQLLLRG